MYRLPNLAVLVAAALGATTAAAGCTASHGADDAAAHLPPSKGSTAEPPAAMTGEISTTGTFTGVFVSCPEIRLEDGRLVMLQGGDVPQWQMTEGTRARVRGRWARMSVCQAPTIEVEEIELLD